MSRYPRRSLRVVETAGPPAGPAAMMVGDDLLNNYARTFEASRGM